jgi:hypothetical protein
MSLAQHLSAAVIAACVCAAAIAAYDVQVRQPRTPRLALVDIAKLYATADQALKARAMSQDRGNPLVAARPPGGAAGTPPSLRQGADFGPALESVLTGLAEECRCAIVAMATVFGQTSSLPDFTTEAGRRLGLVLAEGAPR